MASEKQEVKINVDTILETKMCKMRSDLTPSFSLRPKNTAELHRAQSDRPMIEVLRAELIRAKRMKVSDKIVYYDSLKVDSSISFNVRIIRNRKFINITFEMKL
jgi:hypothetical protein